MFSIFIIVSDFNNNKYWIFSMSLIKFPESGRSKRSRSPEYTCMLDGLVEGPGVEDKGVMEVGNKGVHCIRKTFFFIFFFIK